MSDDVPPASADITRLLHRVRDGDPDAAADLLPRVYDALRQIAASQIQRERASHTLQPTALVNEAYLRLFGGSIPDYRDRGHFLAVASRAMRHVLVDHARLRRTQRRGGDQPVGQLDETLAALERDQVDVLAVHEALEALGDRDPELVQVVEMHFFGGLTLREIGAALDLAERTVRARWSLARAWLEGRLRG